MKNPENNPNITLLTNSYPAAMFHFDHHLAARRNMLLATATLSLDQLNSVPSGFNNSIAWNMGHVLATQQVLLYGLSGLQARVESHWIDRFRKGTRPDQPVTARELDQLIDLLEQSVAWAKEDFDRGIFTEFRPYTTSFGAHLTNIGEAIAFNNVHEGLHLGYVMAMKRAIS